MKPKIIADTSLDWNENLAKRVDVERVPFILTSNGHHYVDDETMDIDAFLADVAASSEITKSAARAPQKFIDAVGDAAEAFIFTVTARLSSSYNNARLAAEELIAKGRKVYVFDSKSAAAGHTSLVMKIHQLIEDGLSFDEIVAKEEEVQASNYTYFILDDYSTLVKSGRMPALAGRLLKGLSIRPVCYAVNGTIGVKSIARGMKKAISNMVDAIRKENVDFEHRTLYISHVNDLPLAETVKEAILARVPFRHVEIMKSAGLVTTYANQSGVVVGF
ncbi:MAG: DegV family protein [Peptoniphilaceae bacterium]|nr:DegV family protein [Peptoniphilaceae bacterium]MDY6085710.1 DegV family protein [Peptoniphilaceae bacterium]